MISVFLSFFFGDLSSEKDCLFIQLARLVMKYVPPAKGWKNALWERVSLFKRKRGEKGEKSYVDILYKQVCLLIGVLYLTVPAFKINKD